MPTQVHTLQPSVHNRKLYGANQYAGLIGGGNGRNYCTDKRRFVDQVCESASLYHPQKKRSALNCLAGKLVGRNKRRPGRCVLTRQLAAQKELFK